MGIEAAALDFAGRICYAHDMTLDHEHIRELLGLSSLEQREKIVKQLDELLVAERVAKSHVIALKAARRKLVFEAYEAGIPQSDIAEVLDVSRQHISVLIKEYRLMIGIPDDMTLAEFEKFKAWKEENQSWLPKEPTE